MATGRRMWASLKWLDRQIVDRDGRLAGNVDDVEFDYDDGQLVVVGIRSGSGALLRRLRARHLAAWMQRMHTVLDDHDGFIPLGHVASVGNHVTVSESANDLGSERQEIWFRDHVIRHIPGSGHAAE